MPREKDGEDALLKTTLRRLSIGLGGEMHVEENLKSDTGYCGDVLSESVVLLKCDHSLSETGVPRVLKVCQ